MLGTLTHAAGRLRASSARYRGNKKMEREYTITLPSKSDAEELAERELTDEEYETFIMYCRKGLGNMDLSGIFNCALSEAGVYGR